MFTIIEKPESISWEKLATLQRRAHEHNHEVGIDMQCANYTCTQLENAVKGGKVYVAIDSTGQPKGMLSVVVRQVARWWHKGKAGYVCYVAVAPECQGNGLYMKLSAKAYKEMADDDIHVAYLNTHIANQAAQKAYTKDGYHKVRFSPGSGTDYYSVEMAKWLDGKSKSGMTCRLMYLLTEITVRILYKPGKIRRFQLKNEKSNHIRHV